MPLWASAHTTSLTSPAAATVPSFFTYLSPAFRALLSPVSLAEYCFFTRFVATGGLESLDFLLSPLVTLKGPPPR